MLISFLGSKDGGLPAGLAEFTNDGKFIRKLALPEDAPYGYDVAIKPDLNRMVTSQLHATTNNYKKPLAEMDFKTFGNELLDLGLPRAQAAAEAEDRRRPRWSAAGRSRKGANHGFTNCALDNSLWVWEGDRRTAATPPASCATPASCPPTCASRPTTATCS